MSYRKRKLKFGEDLARTDVYGQKDTHDRRLPVKVALRREALEAVGGAEKAAVLDLFGGVGVMYETVWREAARYQGGEKELDKVLKHPGDCFHGQAAAILASIDLQPWNVFDLDAYGSPWDEVTVLSKRRTLAPGERIAVILTDGSVRRALMGRTTTSLALLANVANDTRGAHMRWAELARVAMIEVARRMGGHLVLMRQAPRKTGADVAMWYGMAVLEGGPAPEGAEGQECAEAPEGSPAAALEGGEGGKA